MSSRRILVPTLLAFAAVAAAGGAHLAAQLPPPVSNLPVPITGVADLGGTFRGTMLIERFVPAGSGIAAVGTVTGALSANGAVRNVVVQATMPLDVAASRARLNTDPALAQASCDVLHVELDGISINVLGSTVGLAPVAFDIASAIQAGGTSAVSTTSSPSPATPAGTVTGSVSANTTQPGVVPPTTGSATTTAQQPASQTSLGSLLCSVDRFRDVSNPAQLAQQLNAILTALGTPQAS
jgi:hypothetical protein